MRENLSEEMSAKKKKTKQTKQKKPILKVTKPKTRRAGSFQGGEVRKIRRK